MEKFTTIRISELSRSRLKALGKKSETYDDIIIDLTDHADDCDIFWQNRN